MNIAMLTKIGFLFTGLWALLIGVVAYFFSADIPVMHLNQWGDFLAGFAAPLAVLWFIIGYFQQGQELKQNTQMLELQKSEMEKMVKHMGEQSEALKQQLEENNQEKRADMIRAQPKFIPLGKPTVVGTARRPETQTVAYRFKNIGGEICDLHIRSSYGEFNFLAIGGNGSAHICTGGTLEVLATARGEVPTGILEHDVNFTISFTDVKYQRNGEIHFQWWQRDLDYKIVYSNLNS